MAIGLSRMFNIKLPLNFDSPYKAPNIIEFWRRWHMTLSAFLRDYLYIPLGGSRNGRLRRYANLIITMLLGGFWHGAGWTFVAWGGLHGLFLIINHGWRRVTGNQAPQRGWRYVAGAALTFVVVVIAWVPFRANDMDAALSLWGGMFGFNGVSLPQSLEPRLSQLFGHTVAFDGLAPLTVLSVKEILLVMAIGQTIIWIFPNTQQWMSRYEPASDAVHTPLPWGWRPIRTYGVAAGVLFAFTLLMLTRESSFLYFQF